MKEKTMPNFGNSRAPKKAAAGRKPRTATSAKSTGKPAAKSGYPKGQSRATEARGTGKSWEDGRGGRSPQRSIDSAPARKPSAKAAFFEERPAKTYGVTRDSGFAGKERGNNRDERRTSRSERPSYGRDDRAPRSAGRDDRAPRSFGRDRDELPARDDRRKDWSPKGRDSGLSGNGRGNFRNEGTGRPARKSFSDDRAPRTWGNRDRDERAPRTWERDDRKPRRDEDRQPREFGRGFGDRNRAERLAYGKSDATRFEERNAKRTDRVERDSSRESTFRGARDKNPNKKAFFEDKVLDRLESVEQSEAITEDSFEAMGLHPRILAALAGMGAETPFPIQASTIPAAMSGRDVLGRGKTGSGKTIAFTVPLVTKLVAAGSVPRKPGKPRALILAPTRELADQIDRTVNGIARAVGFYTTCIYGGVPQRKQENAMSRGVDIVVATPGRLEDLMAQRIIDLSEVETLVVDEADHMCDLGFIEGVRRIMRAAGDSQKLLFSATLDREVDALVKEFLPDPYVYEVPNEENDTANITHRVMVVDPDDRSQVLLRLVQGHGKSIIFTRTKMTAERLSESLTSAGVPAARLHGDLNQNQRNRNLERFTKGGCRVLVATDVAARGIHVDDVAFVIQVDPPEEYKTYLHRAGRTGRANAEGTVITLIPRSRRRRMEDLLNRAERDGIFSEVRPANPLLAELAGPIAPAPAPEALDFGDSRGGSSREGGRGRPDSGKRSGGRGNYGGNGKGRWADKPKSEGRPRAKKYQG
jgi:superfamily II DNA/RNA helicase